MQITRFTPGDIDPFLALAQEEGWISHRRELAFLLECTPEACLACHGEGGPVGFVTAVRHDRSGWIGNLLVGETNRGRGIGTALFRQATEKLELSGVTTVWLTASPAGRPIYERFGFRSCDRIRRWEYSGSAAEQAAPRPETGSVWQEIDSLGWGDTRKELLAYAAAGGSVIGGEQGFLMLQRLGNGHQIGPFGALNGETAEGLLVKALATGGRLVLDVPASNRIAERQLVTHGFKAVGEVELMYAGQPPEYHPEHIFGLASLGSIG
ncbi:MAG: N-acetyltransferase [Geobacter sp.]|nr:MAG: N-acetyltransferase [Geobacter sp.]